MGPIRSATGSARVRSGWAARSPSSTEPAYTPRRPSTSCPWTASGRNGTGGATRMLATVVSSSALGGDHARREQVVAGEAALAQQPADPAAEGEPGDAGAGHQPAGDRQAERLGLVVERRPGEPGLGDGPPAGRVDADALHRRGVDDDPTVAGGEPGDTVGAAAAHHLEPLAAGELHRPHDVGGTGAPDDQRPPPVVGGVPDRAGLV